MRMMHRTLVILPLLLLGALPALALSADVAQVESLKFETLDGRWILFFLRDRSRSRTGRFSANVEDSGPIGCQLLSVGHCGRGSEVASSIRKAVGRDVHNAHNAGHCFGKPALGTEFPDCGLVAIAMFSGHDRHA